MEDYKIENHGAIGDTYSIALVNKRGTMDWCCFPRFDSPPFFSSLLDIKRGGECSIELKQRTLNYQEYLRDTNVLRTVLKSRRCEIEIIDFMPVESLRGNIYTRQECHRLIRCISGSGDVRIACRPAFNFGLGATELEQKTYGFVALGDQKTVAFSFANQFELNDKMALCEFSIEEGESLPLVIRWNETTPQLPGMKYTGKMLEQTVSFWKRWVNGTSYRGRWRNEVRRSALALKLLTYSPTGAIIAAGTTSLPEAPGYGRNWDYRYSWIRDSTYALRAFRNVGHLDEEMSYFRWLLHLLRNSPSNLEKLCVMYTVEGDNVPQERELAKLSGYMNSAPVRTGNGARNQLQLDVFGSIVEAIYTTFRNRSPPDLLWRVCDSTAHFLLKNWKRKDDGIWEIRGRRCRNTHSAVMSWLALRLVSELALRLHYRNRARLYAEAASRIQNYIVEKHYNARIQSLVRAPHSDELDASVLFAILKGLISPDNAIARNTVHAVEKHLTVNGLVYRYRIDDGMKGKEGAFFLCTFWLIQALALIGEIRKAEDMFRDTLKLSNHLGLMSEEIEPGDKRMLGNFPQAFSHLALIETAVLLDSFRSHAGGHTRRHSR